MRPDTHPLVQTLREEPIGEPGGLPPPPPAVLLWPKRDEWYFPVMGVRHTVIPAWECATLAGTLDIEPAPANFAPRPMDEESLAAEVDALLLREPGLDQLDIAERLGVSLEIANRVCVRLWRRGRIRPA